MKKYKLTDKTIKEDGRTLYQIQAIGGFWSQGDRYIWHGERGGFVESEANLSHDGSCWIFNGGKVFGNALVYGEAMVYGGAEISENARVFGRARVYEGKIYGNARVGGNASVYEKAKIIGSVIKRIKYYKI